MKEKDSRNLTIVTVGIVCGVLHFLVNKLPKALGFYNGIGATTLWSLGVPILLHTCTALVTLYVLNTTE